MQLLFKGCDYSTPKYLALRLISQARAFCFTVLIALKCANTESDWCCQWKGLACKTRPMGYDD